MWCKVGVEILYKITAEMQVFISRALPLHLSIRFL